MILGAAVAVAAAEMDPAGGTGAGAGSRGRGEGDWTIAEEELEVGASLGQGAQGEVFRGRWRRHDGAVAIKRLDADMGGAAGGTEMAPLERGMEELRRMAAACQGIDHVCP